MAKAETISIPQATVVAHPEQYQELSLAVLFPSPTNPRKYFNRKTLAELVASIIEHGVLQPILVRPVGDRFEIVAGERRYRAATDAGLKTIPVVARKMTDREVRAYQLIENLHRDDVHPLEEAQGFKELMESEALDVADVADLIGVKESYVRQRLQLLTLIAKAQEAFLRDSIDEDQARELARLQPQYQEEGLKLCLDKHHPYSARRLRDWVQQNILLDLHGAPFKLEDAELVPAAGSCASCQKRTGFQPALFPDVKKKDTCTDKACFEGKVVAFIDRKKAVHEAKGEKLLSLDTNYGYHGEKRDDKALTRQFWRAVTPKDRCEFTQAGIVVDGNDVGHVQPVCVRSDCKTHFAENVRRVPTEKERAEKKAAARKALAVSKAEDAAIAAVVSKVKVPTVQVLHVIAEAFVVEYWHEHLKGVFKRRGWQADASSMGGQDYRALVFKKIKAMDLRESTGFLMELALSGRFGGLSDRVGSVQKSYGVDRKGIERTIRAELIAEAREKERAKRAGKKSLKAVKAEVKKSKK